jgi:hypothetical protein
MLEEGPSPLGLLFSSLSNRVVRGNNKKPPPSFICLIVLAGGHKGSAAVKGGKVVLSLEWGRPHGGHGTDKFHLVSPEVLHVDSTVCTTDDVCELYTTVYNRKR